MYDIRNSYQAASIQEALELLEREPGAVLVAGGTDVMIRMRHRKLRDAVLISLLPIPELRGIRMEADDTLVIGPMTCFDDIYRNDLIRQYIPMLGLAANQVGSPQIRHIGTIGGNLCNGAVSADTAPSVLALGAQLELTSLSGVRYVPADRFHTGPGKTVLQADREILTAIRIPRENYEGWGGCYLKFGQRNAMEISTLGCAAAVKLDDQGRIAALHLAFGVAASRPCRCPILEQSVVGMEVGDVLDAKIRAEVLRELNPRDSWRASKAFREQLIRTQSVRAVRAAAQQAGGKNHV